MATDFGREDVVDVALAAYQRAVNEWRKAGLDGRTEPQSRHAMRAVVEAVAGAHAARTCGCGFFTS